VKTWDLKDAGILVEEIGHDLRAAASRGLLAAAHRVVHHIVAEVIPRAGLYPPVDRGIYRAAWRARKDGTGAVVENRAPYAAIIEYGARPQNIRIGRKMIDALAAWVRRKGIGGKTVTSASGSRRLVRATESEARSIAWAIAKSMQRRGIFGTRGLRVLEQAGRQIPRFIREEVAREMRGR